MKIKVGEKYTLAYYKGDTFKVKITKIEERSDSEIFIHYKHYYSTFFWFESSKDLDEFKRYLEYAKVTTIKQHQEYEL